MLLFIVFGIILILAIILTILFELVKQKGLKFLSAALIVVTSLSLVFFGAMSITAHLPMTIDNVKVKYTELLQTKKELESTRPESTTDSQWYEACLDYNKQANDFKALVEHNQTLAKDLFFDLLVCPAYLEIDPEYISCIE